jgi:hypothetical protein
MIGGAGIEAVQSVFLMLLVFVAMFAGLARRLKVYLGLDSTQIWSLSFFCPHSYTLRAGRSPGESSNEIL